MKRPASLGRMVPVSVPRRANAVRVLEGLLLDVDAGQGCEEKDGEHDECGDPASEGEAEPGVCEEVAGVCGVAERPGPVRNDWLVGFGCHFAVEVAAERPVGPTSAARSRRR